MADDDCRLRIKSIQDTDGVRSVMAHGVVLDLRGRIGPAVAAHVRRNGLVSGGGKCRKLMAPGVPELWEAV